MILRWPHFAGSQAPHIYISDAGLLLPDVSVTIDGMPYITTTRIAGGHWIPAVDYLGQPVYRIRIIEKGGILLRRPDGQTCSLKPKVITPDGFASGAAVDCSSGQTFRVRSEDDTQKAELRVWVNSRQQEVYRYDPDTGTLLTRKPLAPKSESSSTH